MANKIMMTVRMDAPQYNEVVKSAEEMKVSLNEYCLLMLDVQRDKKDIGRIRGRKPKLREVETVEAPK